MWLKTSDDFPDGCARVGLSDAAYRTHHEGLSWTMRRETGGVITPLDVRRFAETADPDAAIGELVRAGFWKTTPEGWRIVHAMDDQPEPELMAKRRAATKERVRRHRLRQAGLEDVGNGVTERVTKPATRRVTRVGSGLGGAGASTTNPALEEKVERLHGWDACPSCGLLDPCDCET